MKQKLISMLLFITLVWSFAVPAFAENNLDESHYYSSCTFDDGSIIEGRTLENGNLLITLTKDNVLIESTEVDYAQQMLIYTTPSAKSRTSSNRKILFSSFIEPIESETTNSSSHILPSATNKFTRFASVSFRTQIGSDFQFTPKATVYVRNNTPGDMIKHE